MQHQHYDLGQMEAGRVVEVTLGVAANVRIMDHSSYQEYRAGRRHMFVGGFVTASPYRASIPERGHWHVALDLGGQPGLIRSGVRVLAGESLAEDDLPARTSTLAATPSLILGRGEKRLYDVFILHVPEDKAVVRAFAFALRKQGLKVAYDEFELAAGDSAHKKVNTGMGASHLGVAVISRQFVMQGWVTGGGVAGLAVRPLTGKQTLLLLWHDITRGEALEFCVDIAGLAACHTGVSTYDEIAEDIAALLRG